VHNFSLTVRCAPRAGLALIFAFLAVAAGCGGGSIGLSNNSGSSSVAVSGKVFVVVEENHSYSEVIGSSSMPYLNQLANQYGLATQYYADVHPSIGNYLMLTTGQIETIDDSFSGTITDDNVVRELVNGGKSWRSYAESLPSVGYTGGDVYPYFRHHNPFSYFSDVVGTSQANNLVPFSQFGSDLGAGNLPDYSFIVPNALHDAHDGTLAMADLWLKSNIDPLIKSPGFQKNGLLVIVFDESVLADVAHGGGHVAMIVVGPQVKTGFKTSTDFQHQSTLRLTLSTLGINSFPGAASLAPDMGVFFK
jgi:acid phosphatase